MLEFFHALIDPDFHFLRYALLTGLVSSVAFGMIGSYIVARRITYIAAAIAHCVMGGIGAGVFLQVRMGVTWFTPMMGAVAAALGSAMLIGWISLRARQREDTVISAVWSIGMATGLLLLHATPGYHDIESVLFGNILYVGREQLWLVLGLDALVVVLGVCLHRQFTAICFDEEFARLRGARVEALYMLLLALTALTVVLLVQVVGIIMVIALLTLPPAIAGAMVNRLWKMMALASVLCMAFISGGLALSFSWNLPSGPTIVAVAGVAYLAAVSGHNALRRWGKKAE